MLPSQGREASSILVPRSKVKKRRDQISFVLNLVRFITPTNIAEEKAKFFASKTYNPQLRYSWNSPQASKWVQKYPKARESIDALRSQDGKVIKRFFGNLFDTDMRPEFLTLAKKIISHTSKKLPSESLENVTKAFRKAFKSLGLEDYSIEVIDQHGFNFRPNARKKKIVVSKYMNTDFFSIVGELKHEFVHIIRYENGVYNGIPVSEDYLPTEEGLASYCQDYTGEKGKTSLFQHAAEYSMTHVSLNGSLRDVTDYLVRIGFSKELAWQRAIRHKFGFIDTSKPGDIMKPSMYFYHEQLIKELTLDEKYRLFVGKISRNQLPKFPQYKGKISLEQLQEIYSLK